MAKSRVCRHPLPRLTHAIAPSSRIAAITITSPRRAKNKARRS